MGIDKRLRRDVSFGRQRFQLVQYGSCLLLPTRESITDGHPSFCRWVIVREPEDFSSLPLRFVMSPLAGEHSPEVVPRVDEIWLHLKDLPQLFLCEVILFHCLVDGTTKDGDLQGHWIE